MATNSEAALAREFGDPLYVRARELEARELREPVGVGRADEASGLEDLQLDGVSAGLRAALDELARDPDVALVVVADLGDDHDLLVAVDGADPHQPTRRCRL